MSKPLENGLLIAVQEPEFDFDAISRRWSMQQISLLAQGTELQAEFEELQERIEAGDLTRDERKRTAAIMREMQAISEAQQALMAEVLVSVPRSWLVPSAPGEIDWRDPASQDWLLESKYAALQAAMQAARQKASKN